MSTEVLIGMGIAIAILIPILIGVSLQVHDFLVDNERQRFGRYEFIIARSGERVDTGSSVRKADPLAVEAVAAQILEEWFDSEPGETALLNDPRRSRYACIVSLKGYGEGRVWGR